MNPTRILYRNGKIIGPISEWENSQTAPEYREVLGKTILVSKANNVCKFTSPKPINRRDDLVIVEDEQTRLILRIQKIESGLKVSAIIQEKQIVKN